VLQKWTLAPSYRPT